MKRKGFSFACPTLVNDKDEAFQRFLKVAKAAPDKIYNPWPQIACSDNFNQACTQPLVRISYLGSTKLDYSTLEKGIIAVHEKGHNDLDLTPAKILLMGALNR